MPQSSFVPAVTHANFRMGVINFQNTSIKADISIQTSESQKEVLDLLEQFCTILRQDLEQNYEERILASKPVQSPSHPPVLSRL